MPTDNISSLISDMAARFPDRPAVIEGSRQITFRQLDDACSDLASGFLKAGITPGTKTALLVSPGIDFAKLTFGLFRAGAVLVMVDPGIGVQNMGACLAQAEPKAFVGIPKAHLARLLFGWGKDSVEIKVSTGWFPGAVSSSSIETAGRGILPEFSSLGGEAAILFTSGSTGAPKGAVYTHSMFHAQARLLKNYFGIKPGGYSVPTFPLFALFDIALGVTAVIPDMDFTRPASVEPEHVIGPANRYGAEQLFGSPALMDTISRYAERTGAQMSSLKRVISCGAPVPNKVTRRVVTKLAPNAEMYTPYGATESLPVASISAKEILGETAALSEQGRGTCVGGAFPEIRISIIKITDEPIPEWSDALLVPDGTIGEITVSGPIVSPRYYNRADYTAFAKIAGPDGQIYHRMGDLGYKDEKARLWFCGRKAHRVETMGGTLFSVPCEAVFNTHPKVRRSALVGVGISGHKLPVMCVELEAGAKPSQQLTDELLAIAAEHEHTKSISIIMYHDSFPVDIRHNAKISREQLAAWAEGRMHS